jgi:hypothetical protein
LLSQLKAKGMPLVISGRQIYLKKGKAVRHPQKIRSGFWNPPFVPIVEKSRRPALGRNCNPKAPILIRKNVMRILGGGGETGGRIFFGREGGAGAETEEKKAAIQGLPDPGSPPFYEPNPPDDGTRCLGKMVKGATPG